MNDEEFKKAWLKKNQDKARAKYMQKQNENKVYCKFCDKSYLPNYLEKHQVTKRHLEIVRAYNDFNKNNDLAGGKIFHMDLDDEGTTGTVHFDIPKDPENLYHVEIKPLKEPLTIGK